MALSVSTCRFKCFNKCRKAGKTEHCDLHPQRDVADGTCYISIAFIKPEEAGTEEIDDQKDDFQDKEALTEQVEEATLPVLHLQIVHKIPVEAHDDE